MKKERWLLMTIVLLVTLFIFSGSAFAKATTTDFQCERFRLYQEPGVVPEENPPMDPAGRYHTRDVFSIWRIQCSECVGKYGACEYEGDPNLVEGDIHQIINQTH